MWTVRNREIQVGLGIWQREPEENHAWLIDLVKHGESIGYDVFWCGNEKFYRDMWVTLGLVAAHTSRACVGTFIAEPYTYHPALIATAMATLDEAMGGRSILLLGAGAVGFRQLGLERLKPLRALEESITVIRNLLSGESVTYRGEIVQLHGGQLEFPARADLPIWVASRGNRILEMAGRQADGVMLATYAEPVGITQALAHVHRGAEIASRDPSQIPITLRVDVCLDENPAAARASVSPMIAGMIKASAPNRDFIEQAGLSVDPDLYGEIQSAPFGQMQEIARRLPEQYVRAFAWAGTPSQVAERVAAVIEMGVDRISFLSHRSADNSTASIVHQFATEVMPQAVALLGG